MLILSRVGLNLSQTHKTPTAGQRLVVVLLALCAACTAPERSSPRAARTLNEALSDDFVAFGGSDDLQAWLFRTQTYAQGAQPSLPPFALMFPSLVASGLGVTLPQVIDLSGPARWLIATPKAEEVKADKATEELQHSPYLKVTPPKAVSPWRGVVALKVRAGVSAQQLSEALSSAVWDVLRAVGNPQCFSSSSGRFLRASRLLSGAPWLART